MAYEFVAILFLRVINRFLLDLSIFIDLSSALFFFLISILIVDNNFCTNVIKTVIILWDTEYN